MSGNDSKATRTSLLAAAAGEYHAQLHVTKEALREAREHIAITIETLTRGDEFPMLPDGSNPLQSCIDRLSRALGESPCDQAAILDRKDDAA